MSYKPVIAMILLQFAYAGINLFSKAGFREGMSPRVFVVYRHAIATLINVFLILLSTRGKIRTALELKGFGWIVLGSFIGVTVYQNAYYEGINLASSIAAGAIPNMTPAVTFILTLILRLEKINIRSFGSVAKILGTVMGVSGAICMALLKGPKLLNAEFLLENSSLFSAQGDNWVLGCLLLIGSCCCWAFWLIIQIPISKNCPDHLISTTWMVFLGTIQSAVVILLVEKDITVWKLNSYAEIGVCLFGGVSTSVSFFIQTWCISKRGPLFSSMFNPLFTVIMLIMAAIFLHEEIYMGSFIGALSAMIGLYFVLWGKAKELEEIKKDVHLKQQNDESNIVQIVVDDSLIKNMHKTELEEPLLFHEFSINHENKVIL